MAVMIFFLCRILGSFSVVVAYWSGISLVFLGNNFITPVIKAKLVDTIDYQLYTFRVVNISFHVFFSLRIAVERSDIILIFYFEYD
jgi:hypothetical protein